jgi:FAD/FMN-containing dehydrogenase
MSEFSATAKARARGDVVARLRDRLGADSVLAAGDIPPRNEQDWSTLGPARPLAVVRPAHPQDVATTLRMAADHGVAVVPQGGLTGLAGGARPIEGALALSLERLVGVEEIDAAASTMIVRAGTTLQVVQEAAEAAGLFFALDLGSRGSCSIGGNIATNAGGNRVIRYGMARDLVLGLEVALPDGTLLTSLNKMLKNNAGYDLKQVFIGSEGTLGIITRAVLRLHPPPACTMAALCGVRSYESVLQLLASARNSLGPLLSAFEVMWPDYWAIAMKAGRSTRKPLEGRHAFYVLVEAQGSAANDQEKFDAWLETLADGGLIEDAALARSLADVKAFWATRDAAAEFKQLLGPHASFDIGLPVAAMDAYAEACRSELAKNIPGCVSLFYGHIADGNMHIVACAPDAAVQPFDKIDEIVYRLVRDFGGAVSAEHGIGVKKKPFLGFSRRPEELALMRTLKRAIDPENILNPGKVL